MATLEADLARLLGVVGRAEPDGEQGMPLGVLESLLEVVPADNLSYLDMDVTLRTTRVAKEVGAPTDPRLDDQAFWSHFWDCDPCSYPDRTGDYISVTLMSDFYSMRQLHAIGMYVDYLGPANVEYELMVCLPSTRMRSRRLVFFRGSGPDFTDRDRLVLSLLRPHLGEMQERIDRAYAGIHDLTPRQRELLELVAMGRSNAQIARQLLLSPHTVRTHLENIFSRLSVTSRAAAVAAVLGHDRQSPTQTGLVGNRH